MSDLPLLRAVARRFPTIDAAAAEIAHLRGVLSLAKGCVHVISDVHGEHKKLRHIINNASGGLRPLLARVFGNRLTPTESQRLLNTVYYPAEMFEHLGLHRADRADRAAFVHGVLPKQFEIIAALRNQYTLRHVESVFPPHYNRLFRELLWETTTRERSGYVAALLGALIDADRGLSVVRWASRVIRNLSVYELIVAGDLGDRGPRLDRVVDVLMEQPNVRVVWGNHDVSWLGACLGHRALIATAVRLSLRYGRVEQLEEGYGISLAPLETLVRKVYAGDSAERFACKFPLANAAELARMQKAIAIIQFKLEAQLIARQPEWGLQARALMARVSVARGCVDIDGVDHPLLDTALPTVDPADPTALSAEETACVEQLRGSFLTSRQLWRHMRFVARAGSMYTIRDDHVIFHGCVPVDDAGEPLALSVDGTSQRGRGLFEALDRVVQRAVRGRRGDDLDMLWYLWTGPRSPLFGKHAMTTFERYFIADRETHTEHKNPYFRLINDAAFCRRMLAELGAAPERGMIVNGHVPVKPDKGEDPLKRSGQAITIDGAFSEAYGDRGYTLILEEDGTRLAEHSHFESIADALQNGADILPKVREVAHYDPPRRVGDTEAGDAIRAEIAGLERLIEAYRTNEIAEAIDD